MQKALLAELVPAVLNDAPQLASRAELWQVFGVQEAPLRSFAFAGLLLPQRALSAAAVFAAQAHALLSSPCLAQPQPLARPVCRTRAERSGEVRNSVEKRVKALNTELAATTAASQQATEEAMAEAPWGSCIFLAIFDNFSLVFGCIGTDLCKKIRVLSHSSKSTRLSS